MDELLVAADYLDEKGFAGAARILRAAAQHNEQHNDLMGAAPCWLHILCKQYHAEHDWDADEDPMATTEMLSACRELAKSIDLSIPPPCVHQWEEAGGSVGPDYFEKFERCSLCGEERCTETPLDISF